MTILNTPNEPTNDFGNTIDLAFSNNPTAVANIEDHLATTADHYTLSITLGTENRKAINPAKRKVDDIARFEQIIAHQAQHLYKPPGTPTPHQLNGAAKALIEALQTALLGSSKPIRKSTGESPWWTEECTRDHQIWLGRCQSHGRSHAHEERKTFRKTIRLAKRHFWRQLTSEITRPNDIFKVTRWTKAQGQSQPPPPLEFNDRIYESQPERAECLRQALLERRTAEDDIGNPWEEPAGPDLLFSLTVSPEESRDSLLGAGNTTPGADNITVELLKTAWPYIESHTTWLFESCLQVGHHPAVFKGAEVVMIPKLGKRDLSSTGSWRPISLLSCIGKGLERLIARRISRTAVFQGVISPEQFGALPKRAATDLVASLIHDIETALNQGRVATLVLMDVKGAFDAVLRNRLIRQLRRQGWPPSLVRWAASFMTDREAMVRLQETVTASKPLNCGLPQGSPVSPILFMLYTQPIYDIGKRRHIPDLRKVDPVARYGYADDTAMLRIGPSLTETTAAVNQDIQDLVTWGDANCVFFDHKKTEVMHFSRRRDNLSPPILHGDQEKRAQSSIRWLGVWLDRKLNFKNHVQKWSASAAAVANLLRSITNTQRGPPPIHTRKAVQACVIPVLTYGLEAWYPGEINSRGSPTKIQHLIDRMHKVYTKALRTIAPVWITTQNAAIYEKRAFLQYNSSYRPDNAASPPESARSTLPTL
jgi:hypothetical protein